MSAASSTVSTSAPTTRDSDEARAVRAARRRAFGEPGDGKPVDGNPLARWTEPADREGLGGSPLFSGPGGAGSWEQLRGWTESRRAGRLTGI